MTQLGCGDKDDDFTVGTGGAGSDATDGGSSGDAVSDATGGGDLGEIMSIASETGWPVLVARVHPLIGGPDAAGHTHVLDIEVQGSRTLASLPLSQTEQGRWDLDFDGGHFQLVGKVARQPNKLVLDLDDGFFTDADDTTHDLVETTVELPEYPDDGQ